jgi:hypothetical protein
VAEGEKGRRRRNIYDTPACFALFIIYNFPLTEKRAQ